MGFLGIFTRHKLTWDMVVKSAGDKLPCAARFLYDIAKDRFITVPKNKQHRDMAARYLRVAVRDLEKDFVAQRASKLIPFVVEIDENKEVKGLMTGFSSLETGHNIRHEKRDLRRASLEALKFISQGDIKRSAKFKEVLTYRFAL